MSESKLRWTTSLGAAQKARRLVAQPRWVHTVLVLCLFFSILYMRPWAPNDAISDDAVDIANAQCRQALPPMISRSTDADIALATYPTSASAFFLPRTYIQRYNNIYDHEPAAAEQITSWQYQVYASARALAQQLRPPAIIDVGCGSGVKLAKLRDAAESLYCLDFGDNLANVAKDFPFIKRIEIDLNRDVRTLIPRETLRDAIIINADNIEHVGSAIDLIRAFQVWMQDASALLLSTPDRVRHGFNSSGPPPNRAHVRDLTLCEMVTLISKHGPRIAAAGWTENHSNSRLPITLFIVALREDLAHPVVPNRIAAVNSTEEAAVKADVLGPNGHAIGRGIELPPSLYQPWRMDEALTCIREMQRPSVARS